MTVGIPGTFFGKGCTGLTDFLKRCWPLRENFSARWIGEMHILAEIWQQAVYANVVADITITVELEEAVQCAGQHAHRIVAIEQGIDQPPPPLVGLDPTATDASQGMDLCYSNKSFSSPLS